jgi:hypothetical protein
MSGTSDRLDIAVEIISSSGDVEPERVGRLLVDLRKNDPHDATTKLLRAPGRLPMQLPDEFGAFAAAAILDSGEPAGLEGFGSDQGLGPFGDADLGIAYSGSYPPSPIEPPFSMLLQAKRQAGMDLIKRLTNAATRNWVRMQPQFGRQPLPVEVVLDDCTLELWGDEQVYRWFRPVSTAPNAVSSALMALELYGEREIRNGSDPNALIREILVGAESVALAGVAASLALAFPRLTAQSALPLVANPCLLRLDLTRLTHDTVEDGAFTTGLPGREDVSQILRGRSASPHRRRELRNLIGQYVFSDDSELLRRFQALVKDAPASAALWQDELDGATSGADSVADWSSELRRQADASNWVRETVAEGQICRYVQSAERQEATAELQQLLDARQAAVVLSSWGSFTALKGKEVTPRGVAWAISAAEQIGEWLAIPKLAADEQFRDYARRATTDAAAAVLALASTGQAVDSQIQWAESELVNTAQDLDQENWHQDASDVDAIDVRKVLAAGLGYAVALGSKAETEIIRLIRSAMSSGLIGVGQAALTAMSRLWLDRPEVIVRLLDDLVIASQRRTAKTRTIKPYAGRDIFRDLSVLPNPAAARYVLAGLLETIPVRSIDINGSVMTGLERLVEQDIDRRESMSKPKERADRNEMEWTAAVAGIIEDQIVILSESKARALIGQLARLVGIERKLFEWVAERFVANDLGLIDLPKTAAERWQVLALAVCDVLESKAKTWHDVPNSYLQAVYNLIFVSTFGHKFRPEWPHARRFALIFERWVQIFGGMPEAATGLFVWLDRFGSRLETGTIASWILSSYDQTKDKDKFLSQDENGGRISALLGQLIDRDEALFRKGPYHRGLYTLVDRLATRGDARAAAIRQKLTTRT